MKYLFFFSASSLFDIIINDVKNRLNGLSNNHDEELLTLHIKKVWKVLSTGEDYTAVTSEESSSNTTTDNVTITIHIIILISFIINVNPNDLDNIE